ncbi:MAG: gamma-glutamyl-gamma-aminobutyrate hydrolase family protein [Actinobacteria bacterium]|nr:gamma-glutamyl-gamma-aminobutyrate hydrolase family protein [Actinomycetota bacterium]
MASGRPEPGPGPPRPIVGITSYATSARWGPWDMPAALVPLSYCDAVVRAGGRPVVVPPVADGAQETIAALDALILAGGNDIDPSAYGEAPDPATTGTQRLRDDAEIALLAEARRVDLPVLGICRGMQLINVGYGGTLEQHLPDRLGSERHRETWGTFSDHAVNVVEGSLLQTLLGRSVTIKSSHHQAPARIGEGLVLVAAATPDETREAVEDPRQRFLVGVLWHPEEGDDDTLIAALVAAAREFRAR